VIKNKVNTRIIKRELRKAKADLAALSQYLQECESTLEDYTREWSKDLSCILDKLGIEKKPPEEKAESNKIQNENYQSFESEKDVEESLDVVGKSDAPAWVKKSFRKIALKTHPDKVGDSPIADLMISLYEKANNAIMEKDYESVIEICQKLGIECELDPELELKVTRDKQEMIKVKLKKIEISQAWIWGESYGFSNLRLKILKAVLSIYGAKEVEESKLVSLIEGLENK